MRALSHLVQQTKSVAATSQLLTASCSQRWFSSATAVEIASKVECAAVPPRVSALLRSDYAELDPIAPEMLNKLHQSPGEALLIVLHTVLMRLRVAPFIWHKHGSFLDHLRDVWLTLCTWEQPRDWCRLGLFHSAYSNSFVSMNLYNINTDRQQLASLIGEDAENLVYKFCVINRQQVENQVEEETLVRATTSKHIHTGENVELSAIEAAACMTETIADMMDQSFSWQSDLEAGYTAALWPGVYKPTLRMSKLSKFAYGLRRSGVVPEAQLPPIFERCSKVLDPAPEKEARDLYWRVIGREGYRVPGDAEVQALLEASVLNPFVGEPHIVRAQILLQMGRWSDAEHAARAGLAILCDWATQWDKRMPFHAWVAWSRCLIFQASTREWPNTWGGLESLGAIDSSMRFRELNKDRLG